MADYYLNNITGSDSNDGTSEETAWASLQWAFGTTAAVTCGDTIWIKATDSGYTKENKTFSDCFNKVRVHGYSSTPGDNCATGSLPKIIGGDPNIKYADIQNLEINCTRSVWYGGAATIQIVNGSLPKNTYENIVYNITDTANASNGINYIGVDSTSISNMTTRSLHFRVEQTSPSAQVGSSRAVFLGTGSSSVRRGFIGSIFDARNVSGGRSLIWGDVNAMSFSNPTYEGCIFIGEPGQNHNGIELDMPTNSYGLRIEKCIFYNLNDAIHLTTSQTTSSAIVGNTPQTPQKFIIEDCVFVNCTNGIYLDPNIADWDTITIKNCIFYNITSYEVNGTGNVYGSISATQNPYDPDNYCLSDYGNSLFNYPYRTWNGSSFVINERRQIKEAPIRKFGTSDSGSLSLGTGGVGDTVTVSGRSFQKVDDDPIVWRRV